MTSDMENGIFILHMGSKISFKLLTKKEAAPGNFFMCRKVDLLQFGLSYYSTCINEIYQFLYLPLSEFLVLFVKDLYRFPIIPHPS